MKNALWSTLLLVFFGTACSTGKLISGGDSNTPNALIEPLSVFVGQMRADNCKESADQLRSYLQSLDLAKHKMDRELQQHVFQMRLSIKNTYAQGATAKQSWPCLVSAKQALSDLRELEESLGFQSQNPGLQKVISTPIYQASIFTDSHNQLVSNKLREDSVSSLMDLKTADILLLHRSGAQPLLEKSGSDWTDIVVVFRDSEGDLYLFFEENQKVRRRGWWQSNDWIKRNVNRLQVLRPIRTDLDVAVEKLQNRSLKNSYTFGDLIKKEFKLQASSSLVPEVGDVVLGLDLELSPDLVTISEWKDYSAAYSSRVLSAKMQELAPLAPAPVRGERTPASIEQIVATQSPQPSRDERISAPVDQAVATQPSVPISKSVGEVIWGKAIVPVLPSSDVGVPIYAPEEKLYRKESHFDKRMMRGVTSH